MVKEKTSRKPSKRRSKGCLGVDSKLTRFRTKQPLKRLSWASRAILWFKMFVWRRGTKRKG